MLSSALCCEACDELSEKPRFWMLIVDIPSSQLDERMENRQGGGAKCSTVPQGGLVVTPSKNRVTVNLTDEEASQLAKLAEQSKVSKAWLGRRAICSLLERAQNDENQAPLPFASAVIGRVQ